MGDKPFQIIPETMDPEEAPALSVKGERFESPDASEAKAPENRRAMPFTEDGTTLPLGGLSEEEVRDLDTLIRRLKHKPPEPFSGDRSVDASEHVRFVEKHLVEWGEMLLKFDGNLKTLFELLRLFQQKSEILTHRIKTLEHYFHRSNKG